MIRNHKVPMGIDEVIRVGQGQSSVVNYAKQLSVVAGGRGPSFHWIMSAPGRVFCSDLGNVSLNRVLIS